MKSKLFSKGLFSKFSLFVTVSIFGLIGYLIVSEDIDVVCQWIEQNRFLGIFLYLSFCAFSVIISPFSSLPLMPVAAHSWGMFLGGILSALGWWIGALLAFSCSRSFGLPFVERFISLNNINDLSKKMSGKVAFWRIVFFHLVLPVELPSFTLGLLRDIKTKTYAPASLIGIIPFSFVWIYFGGILADQKF